MNETETAPKVREGSPGEPFGSPPPAARPAAENGAEARRRLHELARKLVQSRNRRLMLEYLRLRRAAAGAAQ